jgi:membrane-associated protease RseP (regulator of RpoE activity)
LAQQVGLFLLIVLMVFVFYNDIYRLVAPRHGFP